jgi:anti-sigma regulatory factor (Ser/Thr protein kinase)
VSAPTGAHHVHEALVFRSPDELLAVAVPILRDGLAAGDAAILTCRDEHNALLADALGPHPRIVCLPPVRIYTRAAAAAETYRHRIGQRIAVGARRVGVVGEPNNVGPGPEDWAECVRFESIANATLAECPLTSICAFDVRTLPPAMIEDLVSAHPFVLTPTGRIPNERYVDPATYLRRSAGGPDPAERTSPAVTFAAVTDLHQVAALRNQLRAALDAHEVELPIMADVVASVQELVVNGLVHGRPPVRVRLWIPPGRLVCTVTDAGPGFDDPVAGYVRPDPDDAFSPGSGTGLWLARQLCDRVETAQTPAGFTVRLVTSARAART